MILVTLWSFMIPSVDHSIYFHTVEKKVIQDKNTNLEDGVLKQEVTPIQIQRRIGRNQSYFYILFADSYQCEITEAFFSWQTTMARF